MYKVNHHVIANSSTKRDFKFYRIALILYNTYYTVDVRSPILLANKEIALN